MQWFGCLACMLLSMKRKSEVIAGRCSVAQGQYGQQIKERIQLAVTKQAKRSSCSTDLASKDEDGEQLT